MATLQQSFFHTTLYHNNTVYSYGLLGQSVPVEYGKKEKNERKSRVHYRCKHSGFDISYHDSVRNDSDSFKYLTIEVNVLWYDSISILDDTTVSATIRYSVLGSSDQYVTSYVRNLE